MGSGRVLYIEDNFDNRILIKRVLEADGFTVIEAENGKVGLTKATSEPIDLILIDINLPDIDGYECTARLRQMSQTSKVPIVALTANVMEGDSQKALDAGCDGYITKPIDVDHLPVQVTTYMNHRATAKSAPTVAPSSTAKPGPAAPVGSTPQVRPTPAVSSPVKDSPIPGRSPSPGNGSIVKNNPSTGSSPGVQGGPTPRDSSTTGDSSTVKRS